MADRIEREIEEILRKIDDLPERRKAKAARKSPPSSSGPSSLRLLSRINMRKVMMWSLFAIIVGITIVTTEFRHGTVTPTFLAEPHRERVLFAKAIAATGPSPASRSFA